MQSYPAPGYGCVSFLLFLTHIRFYNIQPAADLRVTSYCDNSIHLEAEKAFRTRDMDLIMTLEGLPSKLISRHVKSLHDDERDFNDRTRPDQLHVLADHRATATLNKLRAAGKTTAFYPLPACRGYLRDGNGGYTTSRNIHTLRSARPEYELRVCL
jgi:hypothetical protein